MKKKTTKFLKYPEIPGGKVAFKKYLESNLKYPKEALDKRIEGIVYLSAEIDDNGNVLHVEIIKGLDGGCNEEAIRLLKNIQFSRVKNRGVRVKTKKRFRIKFKLPPLLEINFQLIKQKPQELKQKTEKVYSYKIQM